MRSRNNVDSASFLKEAQRGRSKTDTLRFLGEYNLSLATLVGLALHVYSHKGFLYRAFCQQTIAVRFPEGIAPRGSPAYNEFCYLIQTMPLLAAVEGGEGRARTG